MGLGVNRESKTWVPGQELGVIGERGLWAWEWDRGERIGVGAVE